MSIKINYNISVYTINGALIKNFHSEQELEHWLKNDLWGSNSYLKVLAMDEINTFLEFEDDIQEEDMDAVQFMAEDFFENYWNRGAAGCQEFYYKIKECCDGINNSFDKLVWKYNI